MRREWRLRRKEDFQRLRQQGQAFRHQWMVMSLAPNEIGHNRYGFVVTKQLGNAVTRNRVRRRLREIVRVLHPHLKPGFDIAFIARADIVEQPFSVVQRTVIDMTRRAKLLQESVP